MNKKIAAICEGGFPDIWEGSHLSTSGIQYLMQHFPGLAKLNELSRMGLTRYAHTLLLVEGLYQIAIGAYPSFVRLDKRAADRGEQVLSEQQFNDFRDYILPTLREPEIFKFMLVACIAHDYGVVEGDVRHFARSGVMSEPVFSQYGFSDSNVQLGKLLVANHSFFGDLFIGEASPYFLIQLLKKTELPEVFLKLELLLNVLDINAAAGGFLSKSKNDCL